MPTKQIDGKVVAAGICLGLAVLVLALFAPVIGFDFVDYDDNVYVFENEAVRGGLTHDVLTREWGRVHRGNYHPLTMLSHALDVEWFGLEPAGHHATSGLLHLANTLLLFLFLARMTGSVWFAAWIAGVFAVHPLNVQSVAWIAERKNVLSTLFWFAGLLAHLDYRRHGGAWRYASVVLCCAAGLLSKPMLVTFPFTILILDGMIAADRVPRIPSKSLPTLKRRVTEYAPLFACASVVGWITLLAQENVGAVQSGADFSWAVRIQTALGAYLWYPVRLLIPTGLSVNYLHTLDNVDAMRAVAGALFLVVVSAVVWIRRRQFPEGLAGWSWYLITLAPVCGLVSVGFQPWADRYAYVPMVGLLWAVGGLVARAWKDARISQSFLVVVAAVTLVLSFSVSRTLLPSWRDSIALFDRAVEAVPGNYIAEGNLAKALLDAGQREESLQHFRAAVDAKPELGSVHLNLGNALAIAGRVSDAEQSYTAATVAEPGNALAHFQLARVRASRGDHGKAVSAFEKATELSPEFLDAHLGLATSLMALGRRREARSSMVDALPLINDSELRRRLEARIAELSQAN